MCLSPKISSLDIGFFNWQPADFQPIKYVYTSNLFYKYMIMPPLKALSLGGLNKQYKQNEIKEKNQLSPEEEDPE